MCHKTFRRLWDKFFKKKKKNASNYLYYYPLYYILEWEFSDSISTSNNSEFQETWIVMVRLYEEGIM